MFYHSAICPLPANLFGLVRPRSIVFRSGRIAGVELSFLSDSNTMPTNCFGLVRPPTRCFVRPNRPHQLVGIVQSLFRNIATRRRRQKLQATMYLIINCLLKRITSQMPSFLITNWYSQIKTAGCAASKHICHSK